MSIATKPTLIAVSEGASSLDVLAARHRAAWDKTRHGRAQWIEGTLELAAVLAEERERFKANLDFSRWLERSGLDKMPTEHDRAALIDMGEDLPVLRKVLEKTDRTSHREIRRLEWRQRVDRPVKTQPAPAARQSKIERQTIDKVLKLHCDQGHSYKQTAEELGLTIGKVASMVRRFGNSRQPEAPPPKPREFNGLKTLTREQVDPEFVGTDLQFRTKYGHVPTQTKQQIEENKRQEELATWLAAISDLEITARTFTKARMPDQNTLDQYLAKPGKAEKLGVRLTMIQAACSSIAHYLDLIRSQQKP